MTPDLLPVIMPVITLGAILAGYRVAFVLAGSAALFILVSDLPLAFFKLTISRIFANVLSNCLLIAIPMFIFMGLVLEKSGVAERALRAAQTALGGTVSGMGLSVLAVSLLLAASSGIVGASVVLLTLLALPRLVEAGFDRSVSAGLIASSGTLAILIPPSVMLIVLGDQLQTPIPSTFAGAIGPGLLLAALYALHVIWRGFRLPAPPPVETVGLLQLILDVAPLIMLVVCILGSIIAGLATPTEASGLGAFGAIAITALYGRFDAAVIMQAARETVIATSMVMMVMIVATCFSGVFRGIGGDEMIREGLAMMGGGPWMILGVITVAIFILGFVLDWLEITLILMPIFGPLVAALDFGNGLPAEQVMIWFGILVALNLQTSFLTPPFGFSLFYLRGAAKDQLETKDVYRGILPFIGLQLLALTLLLAFPSIATGLIS